MTLKNKCALITGANQGLGLEIAKQYILAGAHVMLCARNLALLQKIREELSHFATHNKIFIRQTDIAHPQQVKELVSTSIEQLGDLDILVANAGVYGTKGPLEEINWDEWSNAIDINLKGTVLLCKEVLPHFKKKQAGKILIVAGGGATKPMPFLSAYAASKAGVVRFGETLAEETKQHHIDVNMIAPGALNTRLLTEILEAGPEKVGQAFYDQSLQQQQTGGASPEIGAKLCVYLASNKSNGITGKLISAIWDPWETMLDHIEDLKNSDIYTLRRITPKDRGKNWGDA